MRILEPQFCRMEDLLEDLTSMLRALVFRAVDGACCHGRLVTLHAYAATPFGEKPFLDRAIERALAPVGETAPLAPGPMHLALELVGNAGDAPFRPDTTIAARNALAALLDEPEASESAKDDAVAALARLNLPRLSRRALARVKFLVGVQGPDARRVEAVCLDDSGFACVPEVAPDAQCWVRLRHGPSLALEIAECVRSQTLVAGRALKVASQSDDWTLRFEPAGAGDRTSDLRVVLHVESGLGFQSEGFAIVASPEQGGADWYIAALDGRGEGELMDLPAGNYRVGIALAPQATTARAANVDLSATTEVRTEGGQARLRVQTSDPVLQNSRCVVVRQQRAGGAVFVGETSVAGQTGAEGWQGRAEARFALASLVEPTRGGQKVTVRGAVRTRGAARPRSPAPAMQCSCLVLL